VRRVRLVDRFADRDARSYRPDAPTRLTSPPPDGFDPGQNRLIETFSQETDSSWRNHL
jgi:hypothetical protein